MFQRIVLIIAAVILILTLAVLGILLYNKSVSSMWPPETGGCPDYYTATSNNICQNIIQLPVSNSNCNTGDFSSSIWQGKAGNARKCNWAKECGVSWDGITNATPPVC